MARSDHCQQVWLNPVSPYSGYLQMHSNNHDCKRMRKRGVYVKERRKFGPGLCEIMHVGVWFMQGNKKSGCGLWKCTIVRCLQCICVPDHNVTLKQCNNLLQPLWRDGPVCMKDEPVL